MTAARAERKAYRVLMSIQRFPRGIRQRGAQSSGKVAGIEVIGCQGARTIGIGGAFAALAREQASALRRQCRSILVQARDADRARGKLWLAGDLPSADFVDAGGLMSYGPNRHACWRQAGIYAARDSER